MPTRATCNAVRFLTPLVGEVARGLSLFGGASSEVRRCNCSVVDESCSSLAGLDARCVRFYRAIYLSILRNCQVSSGIGEHHVFVGNQRAGRCQSKHAAPSRPPAFRVRQLRHRIPSDAVPTGHATPCTKAECAKGASAAVASNGL
eukprot:scaffold96008_cov64-Phaeocystis_antarctica.AAC.2